MSASVTQSRAHVGVLCDTLALGSREEGTQQDMLTSIKAVYSQKYTGKKVLQSQKAPGLETKDTRICMKL